MTGAIKNVKANVLLFQQKFLDFHEGFRHLQDINWRFSLKKNTGGILISKDADRVISRGPRTGFPHVDTGQIGWCENDTANIYR